MGSPTKPRPGMTDIKTMSGKTDQRHLSYRSYFKLGALEIQRMRKLKEREATMLRIDNIDKSLSRIDHELIELRNQLNNATGILEKKSEQNNIQPELAVNNGLRIDY
ncbi:hypothetical protein H0A36_05750 [Endozoicomonas sp. SM1973]|uniref:Uncharacterized protein n=1 Tax=Spartinivicinus marinus TaxID=2994442 RepID=A0A853I7H1_9GAMM|nr:hypothetical protein [Spartinivicinus marinus]MCX4028910.1 hypothetical protein [Spartinivicinus marinus]NYZ65507.1 hypothetical protein [Spartinivicinus marinus]